mmetsp:Transcript_54529/g.130055  ORF Transcript_54529/g.130055 Transcript_54529/m.130055 type:complete len:306 (+) Transcript_54529:1338-2255(+)
MAADLRSSFSPRLVEDASSSFFKAADEASNFLTLSLRSAPCTARLSSSFTTDLVTMVRCSRAWSISRLKGSILAAISVLMAASEAIHDDISLVAVSARSFWESCIPCFKLPMTALISSRKRTEAASMSAARSLRMEASPSWRLELSLHNLSLRTAASCCTLLISKRASASCDFSPAKTSFNKFHLRAPVASCALSRSIRASSPASTTTSGPSTAPPCACDAAVRTSWSLLMCPASVLRRRKGPDKLKAAAIRDWSCSRPSVACTGTLRMSPDRPTLSSVGGSVVAISSVGDAGCTSSCIPYECSS